MKYSCFVLTKLQRGFENVNNKFTLDVNNDNESKMWLDKVNDICMQTVLQEDD